MELRKTRYFNKNTKIISILAATAIIILVPILVNNPGPNYKLSPSPSTQINYPSNNPPFKDVKIIDDEEKCDIFTGEWIPNPDAPYYTNTTCRAIHELQNCMKYGRPDSEFMKWRWKPHGCDLPLFNPYQFLDFVRNKSLAFVGDSVGRNQMQSLICLLSRIEYPYDVSPTTDEHFKRWKYETYNFTISYFWSPFLVRTDVRDNDGPTHTGLFNLYLDEFDESWTTQIQDFDYVIINAGIWFTHTTVYYENHRVIGCRYCLLPNITDFPSPYGYRRALRTAFRALNDYGGVTFLRTFAPSHFEGGQWNEGGNCLRRRPFMSNETALDGLNLDMYMTQLEEFRAAKRKGMDRLRLMDTTQMMQLRPDGHPSKYGHWPKEKVVMYNDCVHWCLPGPIDSWAEVLQHMLKMEARRWYEEKKKKVH